MEAKTAQYVANLIQVREFLHRSIDNLQIKLAKEDVKKIQNKVAQLDGQIISMSVTEQ